MEAVVVEVGNHCLVRVLKAAVALVGVRFATEYATEVTIKVL